MSVGVRFDCLNIVNSSNNCKKQLCEAFISCTFTATSTLTE